MNEQIFPINSFLGPCVIFNNTAEKANLIESKYESVSKSLNSLLTSGMNCAIWGTDFNKELDYVLNYIKITFTL